MDTDPEYRTVRISVLRQQAYPDFGPAICRGFFDAYAGRSSALRLLRAFGRLTEVDPPRPGGDADGQDR